MLFTAVAEWVFWDEFGVRFNFIAVDYLVYSKEVVNNIVESYPVFRILGTLVLLAVAITVGLGKRLSAILHSSSVITSYSIHYTKLYEISLRVWLQQPRGLRPDLRRLC